MRSANGVSLGLRPEGATCRQCGGVTCGQCEDTTHALYEGATQSSGSRIRDTRAQCNCTGFGLTAAHCSACAHTFGEGHTMYPTFRFAGSDLSERVRHFLAPPEPRTGRWVWFSPYPEPWTGPGSGSPGFGSEPRFRTGLRHH